VPVGPVISRIKKSRRLSLKNQPALNGLIPLIVVLLLFSAAVGLFWETDGSPYAFTSLHGSTVQIYGHGLYQFDTSIIALGFRTGDAVMLVLGIPLLIVAYLRYRKGLLMGGLLLAGVLADILYTYGSLAIGAAYNNLFLVYVLVFIAALFSFGLLLLGFDLPSLSSHFPPGFPRRGISIFLVVSGIVLWAIWLPLGIIPALISGNVPSEVASYTTVITYFVDMGIVAPLLIVTGWLLRRGAALAYLLAPTLVIFTSVLGIALLAAGIVQILAGVISIGQFIGFTVSFSILTIFAIWFTAKILRNFAE
jgi:hypothetical protein